MSKKSLVFETPFDSYTSSGVLGEGGAGRVYTVTNNSGEEYALKCLSPERISTERLKRFKNELQFCLKHNHPNIIKIVDHGVIFRNNIKCPFYIMERYSGTLRTILGSLNPSQIMNCYSQILDGVEAAHLLGVVHRDLKPENILHNRNENRLALADFGIAHFEEEEIYTAIETKIASRMANFQYSAPEQRVRNVSVDHRADIFSLGLILNEMFTGEILQGAGYKKISETEEEYAYLDELVEMMTQQHPENRPNSIEQIKTELVGRKNSFVALQKYDETRKQVVKLTVPPEFKPIKIVNFDYDSGTLKLIFNHPAPPGWAQEFRFQKGGHQALMGYGPERFVIQGNAASIGVREDEHFIQQIINHAKNYVNTANREYVQQVKEQIRRDEQHRRLELEAKIAEAEKRKNIISNVKL